MNMLNDRVHAKQDATLLFEVLCQEVAVRHWGGPSPFVKAFIFGTARADEASDDDEIDETGFKASVDQLCKELGEGIQYSPPEDGYRITARDGKLDVVVWRRFADKRSGQLIGFGQCKTGTHWKTGLSQLRPEDFADKWFLQRPAVIPIRLYFVADRVTTHWYDACKDGGIVFDRCRIMEHAIDLPGELVDRLRKWVDAAMETQGLQHP
ncbi:MAG: hypothetical protein N2C14_10600 [Planctomycetales bacterium]